MASLGRNDFIMILSGQPQNIQNHKGARNYKKNACVCFEQCGNGLAPLGVDIYTCIGRMRRFGGRDNCCSSYVYNRISLEIKLTWKKFCGIYINSSLPHRYSFCLMHDTTSVTHSTFLQWFSKFGQMSESVQNVRLGIYLLVLRYPKWVV